MKKALMFILLYYFCNVNVFSSEEIYSWVGDWKSNQQEIKSLLSNIPFHSEYLDGEIKIYNKKPDRPITYEVLDVYGNKLITGNVSKENSTLIIISISELPDNGIYTIVLTSSHNEDRVWSQFKK